LPGLASDIAKLPDLARAPVHPVGFVGRSCDGQRDSKPDAVKTSDTDPELLLGHHTRLASDNILTSPSQRDGGRWSASAFNSDDETWEAILALSRSKGLNFEDLADKALADLLKKHKQPVGLKAALKESVGKRARKMQR
jgi:hypothetical protein